LTSDEYCKGKTFTAGGLRHWAHRLGETRPSSGPKKGKVRLAQVVRLPAPPKDTHDGRLVVELGGVRVAVLDGFTPSTLGAVLDVLEVRRRRDAR
jgi:hypothetical protein